MKLLRNPIAVSLLAVLAGIYSVWTLLGARGFRSHLARASTQSAQGPTAPAPLPSSASPPDSAGASAAAPPDTTVRPIDHPSVSATAPRWIESPRRDPFLLEQARSAAPDGPPASELLSLRAIWRQTGSQLAVINRQIVREGDRLLGFAVETIEAQGVWVRGTNGRERITFPIPTQPPRVPPVASQPPPAADGPAFQETITATLPVAPPE
ncbi:MAG: hypothetical protein AB7O66_23525 [Limisphaerales bacterium]